MQQPTDHLRLQMPGERRRAVALASLVTLVIYFVWEAIAAIPNSSFGHRFAELLAQPLWLQAALVAPIWLGVWLVAMAQRQLIAHNEGAYAGVQTITHVRGMRGPGLLMGLFLLVLVALGAIFNVLTPHLTLIGALTTLYLVALGLPNAPQARYEFHPEESGYDQRRVSITPAASPRLIESHSERD